MDQGAPTLRSLLPHSAAALLFASLAVAWSYPLALDVGTHVPGAGPGDNLSFVWNLWWTRFAWQHHLDPFRTMWLFAPVGVDLTQHTHTFLGGAVFTALLAPLSPVAGLNVLTLASLFLNGLLGYLLAYTASRSRFAAVAAGIAFGGAPAILVRLNGHFNLVAAWTIPLAILCFDRAVARRTWRASAVAGLALALVAWNDYYYLVFSLVFLGLSLGFRWLTATVRVTKKPAHGVSTVLAALIVADVGLMAAIAWTGGFTWRVGSLTVSMLTTFNLRESFWALLILWALSRWRVRVGVEAREGASVAADLRALTAMPVAFVVAALPLLASAARLAMSGDYASQPYRWRSGPGGVDLASFVLGNPLQLAYGSLTRGAFSRLGLDSIEGIAWPGLVVLVALVGGWRALRGRPGAARWWAAAAVFSVWSLGPFLTVCGWNTGLVLPGMFLRFVPVVANARIPGRAIVVVAVASAMLLAHVLAAVSPTWGRGRKLGVLLLLVLDCATAPLALYRVEPNHIYTYLASQSPTGSVLELPLGIRDGFGETGHFDHRALYYQTVSGWPIMGGFVARMPDKVKAWYQQTPIVSSLLKLSDPACPAAWRATESTAAEAYDLLKRINVRYVVLDRSSSPARLAEYATSTLPARLVMADGDRELYEVRAPR
jgi:hypothetical protein